MKRIEHDLRAGVAIAALAVSIGAQAQSTRRRPMVAQQAPAATGRQPRRSDIVVTGSRIRRNPLDLDAPRVFIDQTDIAKTGLNSINDVLQRLPSAGGGLNSKFNNSRQPRQSARRRRRRRRLGRDRPALSRLAPHARAGRRPALRQRRVGLGRAGLGRPQLHSRSA